MRIAIVQGHPDPSRERYGRALAEAYARSASNAGHEVRTIEVATLEFPLLRTAGDWQKGAPPPAIAEAQHAIEWCQHLVLVFPLWLGDMPALLKGFLEQTLRPEFALGAARSGRLPKKLLKGRSARIVATMGMPAFFYRLYYRAHSVKNLKRNILEFCGFSPVATSLVGTVESGPHREAWLAKMQLYGRNAK